MSSSSEHQRPYELLSSTRFDRLLSTLKWNNDQMGPCLFLLLQYHLDRLIDAAEQHGWSQIRGSLTFDTLKSTCFNALADREQGDTSHAFKVTSSETSYVCSILSTLASKIRLVLSESGALTASASPTIPFSSDPTSASFFNPTSDNASLFGPVFAIYVDSQSTPSSIFTSTKTTRRTVYNDARLRAGLPLTSDPPVLADVLLYNSQELITETSIFNVAFYRSPYWITPTASTGCLPGVLRRWLLEQGRIHEAKDATMLRKDSIKTGDWVLLFNGVQGCRLGRITSFS